MSISYDCIVGSRKVTAPSVEMWGTNMNILRDPPKGIFTRRKDKVGEGLEITETIDASGDRIGEAINTYPRGVNPFVSVNYGNNGTSGGQTRFGNTAALSTGQSFLPFRIIRDGAFQPPIQRQEDLMPLSRLPRNATSILTNPDFPNFMKKVNCPQAKDLRGVKTETLGSHIRPTATYNIERPVDMPLKEEFSVKYVIDKPIKFGVHSGINNMDIGKQEYVKPVKEIIDNKVNTTAQTALNVSNYSKNIFDDSVFDPSKYIVDNPVNGSYSTNISDNKKVHLLTEPDKSQIKLRNRTNLSTTTALSSTNSQKYIHNDVKLDRNLPEFATNTNISKNIYKNVGHENTIVLDRNTPLTTMNTNIGVQNGESYTNSSRDFKALPPTLKLGGFNNSGIIPNTSKNSTIKISKKRNIFKSRPERFSQVN
jgi:hypothetical protein